MKIRNYTPHSVTVFGETDPIIKYKPEGLARAAQTAITVSFIQIGEKTIPVKKMMYGAVEGLPECEEEDTYYIVSAITAVAAKETGHPLSDRLLVVADPVRAGDGRIIGCRAFSTMADLDGRDHDEFGNVDF